MAGNQKGIFNNYVVCIHLTSSTKILFPVAWICLCLFVLVSLGGWLCVRFTAHAEDIVPALLEC